jgi:hypothetical protein
MHEKKVKKLTELFLREYRSIGIKMSLPLPLAASTHQGKDLSPTFAERIRKATFNNR